MSSEFIDSSYKKRIVYLGTAFGFIAGSSFIRESVHASFVRSYGNDLLYEIGIYCLFNAILQSPQREQDGAVANRTKAVTALTVGTLGILSELAQKFHMLSDTYDPKDIVIFALGASGAYAADRTINTVSRSRSRK